MKEFLLQVHKKQIKEILYLTKEIKFPLIKEVVPKEEPID
jgi:hypothetical protein